MTNTATITTTAEAQQHLDELQAEQRNIGATITTARRAGDVSTVMTAEQRREDLPSEIHAAQIVLLRAQLADAWTVAEAAVEQSATAQAAHEDASAEFNRFRASLRPADTPAEFGAAQAKQGALLHNRNNARDLAAEHRHAANLALADIDDLEAALTEASGDEPENGDGLRRRRQLAANFMLHDPRLGTPADQRHHQVPAVVFNAGSVPPRWVHHDLADNPIAWAEA